MSSTTTCTLTPKKAAPSASRTPSPASRTPSPASPLTPSSSTHKRKESPLMPSPLTPERNKSSSTPSPLTPSPLTPRGSYSTPNRLSGQLSAKDIGKIGETIDTVTAAANLTFTNKNKEIDAFKLKWLINVVRELHKFASDEEADAAIQEYLEQK